MAQLIGVTALL